MADSESQVKSRESFIFLQIFNMGLLHRLFGSKKQAELPSSTPGEPQNNTAPTELNEAERNLLATLGIDEATGQSLKAHTRNKIEGLFLRFLEDGDREPELRGIRSVHRIKSDPVYELNEQRTSADIHFFYCGGSFNEEGYIGVVRTSDRYDILRIMETNGINYDYTTDHVIEFLKKWEQKVPFWINECEQDTLVIKIDADSIYLEEMVKEALVLCPDLTAGDDSQEAFKQLLELVRKSREIYFWWD